MQSCLQHMEQRCPTVTEIRSCTYTTLCLWLPQDRNTGYNIYEQLKHTIQDEAVLKEQKQNMEKKIQGTKYIPTRT